MKLRVMDKDAPVLSDRRGEAYELYLRLIRLEHEQPGKKAVVEFTSVQNGQRRQTRIAQWADEDGYQLFSSAVPRTNERVMYLEKQA